MKSSLVFLTIAAAISAQTQPHPTGPRITPPTISSVAPLGIARGMTVEMTVEGFNLAGASGIHFSEPGIKGKIIRVKELPDLPDIRLGSNGTQSTIDVGPLPPRNQVTVEVDVSPEADIGQVAFRVLTPLGTSPEGRFLIEPFYGESPDREPNDTLENAFETYLPSVLAGAISRPGDVDYYKIKVNAGEQLVFENGAMSIGSSLQPVVSIVTPEQSVVREFGVDGGESTSQFAHTFDKAGTYYVKVADFQQSGRSGHFYRIKVGRFALALSAYPLGLEKGKTRTVSLTGYNLGGGSVDVEGRPSPGNERAVMLRAKTPAGNAFNELKLALGTYPELESNGTNRALSAAQALTVPVTVNGRIEPGKQDHFRVRARKGEAIVMEVEASRFGSELDSVVEALDAAGKPLERGTVRAVLETFTVLRDHDSTQRGIRLQAWNGFNVGDYVMIGGEIIRVAEMPPGPDDDMIFEAFGGQRLTYFDTSSEAQAIDKPVYKVQIHPPGAQFTPNGLPLVRLSYRNDDGGPGYGKDSLLRFTAPADGDYIVRIGDSRGLGGKEHAYRLTMRPPTHDFRLSVNPRNPNVPVGGVVPLTVTAFRIDGFNDPIEVALEGLPPGLSATKGTIAKGQISTTLLLSADASAKLAELPELKVLGRAGELAHYADSDSPLKLIALAPKADIAVKAETREVTLEAGSKADVALSIERQNGFGGRVPVVIRNLPPTVRVLDVGLNGVLINEDETKRGFTIAALPNAEPLEQWIYVGGAVETRSPQQNIVAAPEAILLKVVPRRTGPQVSGAAVPHVTTSPKQ